ACGENELFLEVRVTVRTFQIYSDEIEGLPDSISEDVHVQSLLSGYGDKIASNLFLRSSKVLLVYQVHLVQDDQGGNIPPVPGQNVNQLLVCNIFAYQNATITNPVGFDYSLDSCRGQFRKLDTRGES